jgi:ADP-ribose pyrophosphatase YjhB (NUDIX family)
MEKPLKYVVAIILRNVHNPHEFLTVKRPADDSDLQNAWGLPAAPVRQGELIEEAAARVCFEKLHCRARPLRFIGAMSQQRNNYDICLIDIEMTLDELTPPDVHKAQTTGTKYVAQKWTTDPLDLMPSAKHGSCCSSIFLTDQGLLPRKSWIDSLEGSTRVG